MVAKAQWYQRTSRAILYAGLIALVAILADSAVGAATSLIGLSIGVPSIYLIALSTVVFAPLIEEFGRVYSSKISTKNVYVPVFTYAIIVVTFELLYSSVFFRVNATYSSILVRRIAPTCLHVVNSFICASKYGSEKRRFVACVAIHSAFNILSPLASPMVINVH